MTQTHALLAASGLALAAAFSVPPPPLLPRAATPAAVAARPASATVTSPSSLALSSSVASEADATAAAPGAAICFLDEVDAIFDCVDANGDGSISPAELRSHLVDRMGYDAAYADYLFDAIDTDASGSISREELGFAFYNFEALSMYATFGVGGADVTRRPAFEGLALAGDSSGTAVLSDLADLVFDMVDADGSGEITADELRDHFATVTGRLDAGQGATRDQADEYVRGMFATLDADGDAQISRAEVRAAFEKYDFKLLAQTFGLRVYQKAEAGAAE